MPLPRILVFIVPEETDWVETSGKERSKNVFEKKVSTSIMLKKIIAAFFTHSLFLTFSSAIVIYPFTEP